MGKAAIVVISVLLLTTCGRGSQPDAVSSTPVLTTTTAAPTTTTTAEPSTTTPTTTTVPPGVCETEGCLRPPGPLPYATLLVAEAVPLAAGTFATSRFTTPMTFEVATDGEWLARGETEEVVILASWVDEISLSRGMIPWWGAFVVFMDSPVLDEAVGDDFPAAVRTDPCTEKMSEPVEMEISGWPAVMVETQIAVDTAPPEGDNCTFFGLNRSFGFPQGLDTQSTRLIDVDVAGDRVLIQLLSSGKAQLEELAEKADRLFATVEIGG